MKTTPRSPCGLCGAPRCRSVQTWACWQRAYAKTFADHGYVRSHDATRLLRRAGIDLQMGPQPSKGEAYYAPEWAVQLWKTMRKRLVPASAAKTVAALQHHPLNGPAAPDMLELTSGLRVFAVLRGWRFEHGTWYTS